MTEVWSVTKLQWPGPQSDDDKIRKQTGKERSVSSSSSGNSG